jgi:hypothetical protein
MGGLRITELMIRQARKTSDRYSCAWTVDGRADSF